ncbi:MAG: transcriptional regulator [Candidatus Thorarchaeota archaeon]
MPSKQKKTDRSSKEERRTGTQSGFDELLFGEYRFIHEPNRLLIISQLYALEQVDMLYLKKTLPISWGNLSFHTTQLEERGYIIIKKQFIGKKSYTLLRITSAGKTHFENYRNAMRNFLS